MEINPLKTKKNEEIKDLFLLRPTLHNDSRGYFYESWNQKKFQELTETKEIFVQDNHSFSKKGVLRGLHFQTNPFPQGKLVRCTEGEIFDVAVDIRTNSKTFGEWAGVRLNKENKFQFWIPIGFAHGFLTISDYAEVQYKTTNYWDKYSEYTLKWDDININISWPLNLINSKEPLLSAKDQNGISFEEVKLKEFIFK